MERSPATGGAHRTSTHIGKALFSAIAIAGMAIQPGLPGLCVLACCLQADMEHPSFVQGLGVVARWDWAARMCLRYTRGNRGHTKTRRVHQDYGQQHCYNRCRFSPEVSRDRPSAASSILAADRGRALH